MAKKTMKRSLALGALMAFAITGSAMAAELTGSETEIIKSGNWTVGTDVTLAAENIGDSSTEGIKGYDNIVIGDYNNYNRTTVTVDEGKTLTLTSGYGNVDSMVMNTDIKGDGNVVIKETGTGWSAALGYMTSDRIEAKNITITAVDAMGGDDNFAVYGDDGDDVGVITEHVLRGENITLNADGRTVYAAGHTKIDIVATGSLKIESDRKGVAITSNAAGQKDEESNNIYVEAPVLDLDGGIDSLADNSKLEIKADTIKLDGNIRANVGTVTGLTFNGTESYANGTINAGEKAPVSFSNGATWTNTGASNVNDLTLNGGNIELGGDIVVTNLDGNGGTVNVSENDKNNTMTVNNNPNNTELDVRANDKYAEDIANMNDADRAEALEALAAQVVDGNEKTAATTVGAAQGDIAGEIIAEVKEDGTIGKAVEKIHAGNQAVTEANVNVKAMWRAHMNDMNKRMGELRNSNGEHGVWVRMTRGEMSYKGDKAQYNQYQLGYDEKLSVNKAWTVGAAVTFAEGDSSFVNGGTDDKSTAFAIYGSKLNNDGTFIDLIARAAHMESDVTVSSKVGDYDANGYSVGAEFGKRIKNDNGCWIEPQVELTYGTVQESKFKLGDSVDVTMGDMDSFIGRLGFALGKDIKAGNVYARASYLYDFDGETDATYSNGKVTRTHESDLGGGWWEVGVGANINLSKATYVYADMEKTFGGELNTDWQWNLGVRYSF